MGDVGLGCVCTSAVGQGEIPGCCTRRGGQAGEGGMTLEHVACAAAVADFVPYVERGPLLVTIEQLSRITTSVAGQRYKETEWGETHRREYCIKNTVEKLIELTVNSPVPFVSKRYSHFILQFLCSVHKMFRPASYCRVAKWPRSDLNEQGLLLKQLFTNRVQATDVMTFTTPPTFVGTISCFSL